MKAANPADFEDLDKNRIKLRIKDTLTVVISKRPPIVQFTNTDLDACERISSYFVEPPLYKARIKS